MEELTYKKVAKNIVKETVASALFIDDKALESFKSRNYDKYKTEHKRTLELYKDFKDHDCLLHSFKFTKSGWKKNSQFYLRNKDLLILDWQLVGEDHSEALKILEKASAQKSLHFICIYTQEAKDSVKNELNRYFLGRLSKEQIEATQEYFRDTDLGEFWEIDEQDKEWEEFEEQINNILNSKKADEKEQVEAFKDKYELEDEQIAFIKELGSNEKSGFARLRTALRKNSGSFSKEIGENSFTPSKEDQWTFYINHTIVKIFAKGDIDGDQLYESFLDSFLSNEQNIFLSLMGLEMRNRFRENSAFIGKDFDGLSENAFFHHKQMNEKNGFVFTDFLRDILKDQVASFIYEKDMALFQVIGEYMQDENRENKLKDFLKPENKSEFIEQVFKLNHFYNRLNINERSKKNFLTFGDVYKTNIGVKKEGKSVSEEKFFLCITPHCDCLNPTKIDNQFWFIEGKKVVDTESAKMKVLKNTDGLFLSFIQNADKVEAIYWHNSAHECKPRTFFIQDNRLAKDKLKVYYNHKEYEFEYIETLKENYAQRLANKAFGYPLRVGIDFIKKN
ncbi:response regulator receiver domain [Salegentibacter chungangensis]|uniref:Response regulator receiver domain n=1 Tax=Salegentibacter chungangensis TaxID=1335724 RepID=A0ABW3NMH8_9FLAO